MLELPEVPVTHILNVEMITPLLKETVCLTLTLEEKYFWNLMF